MPYVIKNLVTEECYNDGIINDDMIYKQLVKQMVSEMPLSELQRIFKLTKIDPNSEYFVFKRYYCAETSEEQKEYLDMLKNKRVISFEVFID